MFVKLCTFRTCNVFVRMCPLFWHILSLYSISNCWDRPRGLQKIVYFN